MLFYNFIQLQNANKITIAHGNQIYNGVGSSYKLPAFGKNLIDINVSTQIVKYVRYLI